MSEQSSNPSVLYKEIPGHPGRRVGTDGSVWSCLLRKSLGRGRGYAVVASDSWRRIGSIDPTSGRPVVNFGKGESPQYIHRLVLEAFVSACPEGMECCHRDGNNQNNNLDNLYWGTSQQNTNDQRRHGKLVGGERHGNAKLTNAQVEEIRALKGRMPQAAIARLFGVSQPTVSVIQNCKSRTPSSHAGKGLHDAEN